MSLFLLKKRSSGCFGVLLAFLLTMICFLLCLEHKTVFGGQLRAVECLDSGFALLIFDGLELVKIEA